MASAFERFIVDAWPIEYKGSLDIAKCCGGTPTDSRVIEGWIKTKVGTSSADILRAQIAEVMTERGVSGDEAAKDVIDRSKLNGFKRTPEGQLMLEGRHLKAAIKEACSIAVASDKIKSRGWGKTNKGLLSFVAEHVCVVEDALPLFDYDGNPIKEVSGVNQRFVTTWRGTGIQYEEFVTNARVNFTILCDYEFSDHEWALIWLTGEQQGIGATRSQGYGRYEVSYWERTR